MKDIAGVVFVIGAFILAVFFAEALINPLPPKPKWMKHLFIVVVITMIISSYFIK